MDSTVQYPLKISVENIEQTCGEYCAVSIKYSVESTQQYPLNSLWILLRNINSVFYGEYCAKSIDYSVDNIEPHPLNSGEPRNFHCGRKILSDFL
jgi:hypothetical protein